MSKRLCKCGRIVVGDCPDCKRIYTYKPQQKRTTAERGYDSTWRKLSEWIRAVHPLCAVCQMYDKVTPATEVHHIVKVAEDASNRLNVDNLLPVCKACHKAIEDNAELAAKAKQAMNWK